jgi:hypothetical protein
MRDRNLVWTFILFITVAYLAHRLLTPPHQNDLMMGWRVVALGLAMMLIQFQVVHDAKVAWHHQDACWYTLE